MKIHSTKEYHTDRLKILVYGESGNGKTTLASTIEEPVLVISAESGLLSLSGYDLDVIDLTRADNDAVIPEHRRFEYLLKVIEYLQTEEARKKYKWVFIDSLSEISEYLMASLKEEFPEKEQELKRWGILVQRMKGLVKIVRDLPSFHVVFTGLSEIEKDQDGRRYKTVSLLGRKSAQDIPALFDLVFYLGVFDEDSEHAGKRYLQTQATSEVVAKDRSGKFKETPRFKANLKEVKERIVNDAD